MTEILAVTGTGTGVGKTVVTAALAAICRHRGARVGVLKPAQTGVAAGEPGDVHDIRRLSGVTDIHECTRFPEPLAPATAARRAGTAALDMEQCTATTRRLATRRDITLVEGAGGLLVRYDEHGRTLADLASRLQARVLVVVRAGLGTLNETALTLEAMRHRGLPLAGLVIGAWPARPDTTAWCNVADLETIAGKPILGAMPEGAGDRSPAPFLRMALEGLNSAYADLFG